MQKNKILNTIDKQTLKRYWLLTGLMMLPNLLLLFVGRDIWFSSGVMLKASLLWIILSLIVSNVRLLTILAIPFLFVLPAECYFIYTYGYPSTRFVIALLAETSLQETKEFLSGLWFVLLSSLILVLGFSIWLIRGVQSTSIVSGRTQVIVLALLVSLIVSWQVSKQQSWAPLAVRQFTLANSFPVGVAYRTLSYGKSHLDNFKNKQLVQQHHFSATSSLSEMTVILVIGESARPDHWGLNGYIRDTTPRLGSRSDIYFMGNLITPWTLTTYSTPLFITRKPATYGGIFPEKSLFSAFESAGFNTYWFANQEGLTEMALHIGEASNRKSFNLAVQNDLLAVIDEEMLPDIEKAVNSSAAKKFIVVHTKGSHWDYYLRYPPEFRVYSPDKIEGAAGKYDSKSRDTLVNAYDNSIIYTDYFLNELIQKVEESAKPAAILYVSDHGEGLYENGCKIFGHGNDTEINFHTAGLLWVSPELVKDKPKLLDAISSNTKKPISTELTIFNTLADLGGLNLTEEKYSLLSSNFEVRQRLVNTSASVIDFDQSAREGACKLVVKEQPTRINLN